VKDELTSDDFMDGRLTLDWGVKSKLIESAASLQVELDYMLGSRGVERRGIIDEAEGVSTQNKLSNCPLDQNECFLV
jgi:hypothetical protein